ncbi:unnamed protein product [Penicillium nalgiovense]|nr:unnamed protein product [Penicillium nalgiovense]
MHYRSPSPSGFIEPLITMAHRAPDARSINQTDLTTANSRFERPNEECKYTPGIWFSGGSTAVPLSGKQTPEDNTVGSTISRHFRAEIDTTHTDIPLVICGFVGGLLPGNLVPDAKDIELNDTGNTIFLALGASGQPATPPYLWAKSLVALSVFVASNIFFIHMHRLLTPRRRSTMIISFGTQTIALWVTALLLQLEVITPKPEEPRAPIEWMQVLAISLLAFQAGGQICASRVLVLDEIPTVVVTAMLSDLLIDPKLTAKSNPKRDRRVAAFLALFLGAMTGGGLSKTTGMASSIWLAMGLKLMVTLGWVFWRREGRRKSEFDV